MSAIPIFARDAALIVPTPSGWAIVGGLVAVASVSPSKREVPVAAIDDVCREVIAIGFRPAKRTSGKFSRDLLHVVSDHDDAGQLFLKARQADARKTKFRAVVVLPCGTATEFVCIVRAPAKVAK